MTNISFDITGKHKPITRVITPFHSLNVALSGSTKEEYGIPTRAIYDLYGDTGVGKSTAATCLASYISQSIDNAPIAYCDLEGQSENMVINALQNSGFSGGLKWVEPVGSGKNLGLVERLLNGLKDAIIEKPNHIGILDSVAAVTSKAEFEGDFGDANMGRRAFLMAQFSRNITVNLLYLDTPVVVFLLNHHYKKGGAIGAPIEYTSPGGDIKKNLAKVRIRMTNPFVDYVSGGKGKIEARWSWKEQEVEMGAWVVQGKVEKNREGAKNTTFQLFVYGGQGVHVGMTALIDCLASGLAEVKTGGKVLMDGVEYGTINKIVATKREDKDFFIPFINELRVETVNDTVPDSEEE